MGNGNVLFLKIVIIISDLPRCRPLQEQAAQGGGGRRAEESWKSIYILKDVKVFEDIVVQHFLSITTLEDTPWILATRKKVFVSMTGTHLWTEWWSCWSRGVASKSGEVK